MLWCKHKLSYKTSKKQQRGFTRAGEERRMKRCKRWKGNIGGQEDDLGPCNYLFCISIMQLHEYQSRALDGQPRRNEREIEGGLWGNDEAEEKKNNCRCIFFQSSREMSNLLTASPDPCKCERLCYLPLFVGCLGTDICKYTLFGIIINHMFSLWCFYGNKWINRMHLALLDTMKRRWI